MNKEIEEAVKLLNEMRDNCLNAKHYNDKERYNKAEAISTMLDYIENSISKEKVEETIKKARLKMFLTRIMNKQEMYFLDKCVHVINDIQNELLEGK